MKSNRRAVVSGILLSLVFAPFLIARSSAQTDAAAILAEFSRFQSALASREAASIGDFYSDDAVSLLQNNPVRRGRQAIVERWKQSLSGLFLIQIASIEVSVSTCGQDAYQFGTFQIQTADTAKAILASGKVMFLWKKQGDRWRIFLEMDNFDSTPSQKPPVPKEQLDRIC